VLSSFDFSFPSGISEGVTTCTDGTIFTTDESPSVFMLTPISEPVTYALMLACIAGLAAAVRHRA